MHLMNKISSHRPIRKEKRRRAREGQEEEQEEEQKKGTVKLDKVSETMNQFRECPTSFRELLHWIGVPCCRWSAGTFEVAHDGLVVGLGVRPALAPHDVLVAIFNPRHFDLVCDSLRRVVVDFDVGEGLGQGLLESESGASKSSASAILDVDDFGHNKI